MSSLPTDSKLMIYPCGKMTKRFFDSCSASSRPFLCGEARISRALHLAEYFSIEHRE